MKEFEFKAEDGSIIKATRWDIENPKGIVQILHGLAEHISRYDEFAAYLNSRGYTVAGEDHRGHGRTAGDIDKAGFFADSDGWNRVISDNLVLGGLLKNENPGIPFYIFGHSMGSFLCRKLIAEAPAGIDKVVLSGSGDFSSVQLNALSLIARLQSIFAGKEARAKLLDSLSFSKMNDQFKPGRTGFEWLSRDEQKVDEYVADPFCGFVATIGLYLDFADGLKYLKSDKPFEKTPKDLPMLFYSGEMDPVGGNGSLVRAVSQRYIDSGFKNIELVFNTGGRHESLNETNRREVYVTIADWLDE